jgi:hypothetical protein
LIDGFEIANVNNIVSIIPRVEIESSKACKLRQLQKYEERINILKVRVSVKITIYCHLCVIRTWIKKILMNMRLQAMLRKTEHTRAHTHAQGHVKWVMFLWLYRTAVEKHPTNPILGLREIVDGKVNTLLPFLSFMLLYANVLLTFLILSHSL